MTYKVILKGTGAYSQSKFFTSTKKDGESSNDFEARCWREKAHANADGFIVLPVFCLKNALDTAASYLSHPVPGGGGKRTFAKLFRSAVRVQTTSPVIMVNGKSASSALGSRKQHVKDVKGEWINANSDGRRGSGKRVPRCFPMVENWSVEFEFTVMDARITEKIFLEHLAAAGVYIGIGRFRPENGGCHGCFEVYYQGKRVEPPSVEKVLDKEGDTED